MFSFASREEHLRQRAARGWTEDEDVLVCVVEIDRLRTDLTACTSADVHREDAAAIAREYAALEEPTDD
jgi:hypothetical protein